MFDRIASLVTSLAKETFIITRSWAKDAPYLTRWTLWGLRHSPKPAVFLHRFQRSDADELHSHPWDFTSFIIWGGYWEITPGPGWKDGVGPTIRTWYGPGNLLRRSANWIHRIEIPEGKEAWTLIYHGPKQQSWGFFCPNGYRHWTKHIASAEANDGDGCA